MIWVNIIWLYFLPFFFADQPEFKGGQENLTAFITRSMIYPEYAKLNCLQGTIQVSFKLDKKGRISDSKVQKGFGVDLDKEALRIVRLTSGKWVVPAGYDTTVALVLPINFALKDFKCEQRPRDLINRAIANYKARQDLTKAVINYYEKRSEANIKPEDEERILKLKDDLGIDERYLERLTRQGQTVMKQGDNESACEIFTLVKGLGSNKADRLIAQSCN
jgi:TonB family protein